MTFCDCGTSLTLLLITDSAIVFVYMDPAGGFLSNSAIMPFIVGKSSSTPGRKYRKRVAEASYSSSDTR
jgi:hypothetical protein